ncbi:MAG: peptidylprolyl isomerase [Longimicrobiales bacterium]
MRKLLSLATTIGVVGSLVACDAVGQAMTSHTDVLARAGGHELSVDQAVELLTRNPRVPAQTEVVDAIANLWVDYTLFARAAAEDTSLAGIDLDALLEPWMNQELVWGLREQVIQVDTMINDSVLLAEFQRRQPNAQVRARHVLFRLPPNATDTQRDSVVALARQVREQAVNGADFAALAREHSEDPGSAAQGGDLGFFGRGQMVGPFEDAAFALEPGQVSDLVETPYGFHVIKLEERQLPDFETNREEFRAQLIEDRRAEAEELYVRGLTDSLNVATEEGAVEVAKDLASKPGDDLNRRAANRELTTYMGGAFTAGEYLDFIRGLPSNQRSRLASAQDEEIENLLDFYTRNEILVAEARKHGITTDSAQADSMRTTARAQLRTAASAAGLLTIQAQEAETEEQAIDRKVMGFLRAILAGEQNVLSLGPLSYTLRSRYDGEVFERAFPVVVERVEATRPSATPAPSQPMPTVPPAAQPDTSAASQP